MHAVWTATYVPKLNAGFSCSRRIISRVALYQASLSGLCDGTLAWAICRSIHLSVGLSVRKVYCGKTAEWIRMPFGMVSGVGQGMDVLDGVVIVESGGAVLG